MNAQENVDNILHYHTMVSKGARMNRMRLEKINQDELSLLVDIMALTPPTKDDDRDLVSAFEKLDIPDGPMVVKASRTVAAPKKAVKTTCPPKRRLDENGNCPAGMEQRTNKQGQPCCYVKKNKK